MACAPGWVCVGQDLTRGGGVAVKSSKMIANNTCFPLVAIFTIFTPTAGWTVFVESFEAQHLESTRFVNLTPTE